MAHFPNSEMVIVYSFPVVAAILGWLFFAIAAKVFWRSGVKSRFSFQGILKNNLPKVAGKLENYLSEQQIAAKEIGKLAFAESTISALRPAVEKEVAGFVDNKLEQRWPMISMFLNAEAKEKMKDGLTEELLRSLPGALQRAGMALSDHLEERHFIAEKLNELSAESCRQAVFPVIHPVIRRLSALGALLGGIIGMILTALVLFFF
ncbi:MAG TPA: hypothetical protein VFL76_11715 [Edaphocola sp.]|nr:hypothetical protein [Edaphocola sp.]